MTPDTQAVAVPVGRSAGGPDPRSRSTRPAPSGREQPQAGDLTPPIDIYEEAEGLVLEADLPGVSEDRLTIQLEDNVLILRGEVAPAVEPSARTIHEEYRPGPFWRSFILSDEVDRARISASLRNGVLRVSLPRAERSKPRRIEIKSS